MSLVIKPIIKYGCQFILYVLVGLMPLSIYANDESVTDSLDLLKEQCYELLHKGDNASLFDLFEKGKAYARKTNNASGYIDFLTFEAEYYYMTTDGTKAIPIYREIIALTDEDFDEYINVVTHLAQCYQFIEKHDSAFFFIERAIELSEDNSLQGRMAYRTKGDIYQSTGEYAKAIEMTLKSVDGLEEIEASDSQNKFQLDYFNATAIAELGDLFLMIGDVKMAKQYLLKAAQLGKKAGLEIAQNQYLRQIAHIYLSEANFDSASYYYNKVYDDLNIKTATADNFFFHNRDLLLCYVRKGDLQAADNYVAGLNEYFPQMPVGKQRNTYFVVLAEYYLAKGNASKALNLLSEFEEQKGEAINVDFFRLKHLAFDMLGQKGPAYKAQTEYHHLKDSLVNVRNNQMIYSMEGKYKKKEQELAIKELSLFNIRQKDELKRKSRTIILGGTALATLSLIGVLGIGLYRVKKKAAAELKTKNQIISDALSEKELMLKEIHHRVKNNLQIVSSLLSLQSNFIEDETALSAIQEGRDRVRSMSIIHQNLYSEDNLTGIDVQDYFRKLAKSLFNSYNIKKGKIDLELNIEKITLDVDTIIPLGLIVNELLTNALKYAFPNDQKGVISISLKERNNQLILVVADNGVGFNGDQIGEESSSFGYQIIQAFKEKLDAELSIEESNGARITFAMKEYRVA